MSGIEELKEALGETFANKVEEASKVTRKKVIPVNEVKGELIEYIKKVITPEKTEAQFPYNGILYDIVLAKTPQNIRIKETKYSLSVGFQWKNRWLYTFLQQEEAEKLTPDTYYFLVGYRRPPREVDGRKFYNMRVDGIITMGDIKEHKGEEKEQDTTTEEAIQEHAPKAEDEGPTITPL